MQGVRHRDVLMGIMACLIMAVGVVSHTVAWDRAAVAEDDLAWDEELENVRVWIGHRRAQLDELDWKHEQVGERLDAIAASWGVDQNPGPVAYLTFDDGPSHHTEAVLDVLQHYGIQATFFVIGNDTDFGRAMYRRIVDEGHAIGNHTYSHNYSHIYQSVEAFMADIYRLEELVHEATGVRPGMVRFPGGSNTPGAARFGGPDILDEISVRLESEGYTYYDWNVEGKDSVHPPPEPDSIVDNVLSASEGRGEVIILLHDSPQKGTTVEALPDVIRGLQEMGFRFEVLDEAAPVIQF